MDRGDVDPEKPDSTILQMFFPRMRVIIKESEGGGPSDAE